MGDPSYMEKKLLANSRKPMRKRPKVLVPDLDVYTAALERIRWIFDEFDNNVAVSNSGGKDSTVVLELAAIVAAERGIPLKVQWLDQECEFEATVDYQRYIMNERDDIDFMWYQIPFKIFNATNHEYPWLNCWWPDEEWVRPKEPNSIHENTFGTTRFKPLLDAMSASLVTPEARAQMDAGASFHSVKGTVAILTGLRMEESPARRLGLIGAPGFKWITWASTTRKGTALFHPIYDWSYRDVWKAIHDHDWKYNTHYDVMYRYGVGLRNMRVSNYTHESALNSMRYLQEVEPKTWEAASKRLKGVNAYGHLGSYIPENLPYMFASWQEYYRHLLENLYDSAEDRNMVLALEKGLFSFFPEIPDSVAFELLSKVIAGNDLYGTTIQNWKISKDTKAQRDEWAAMKAIEDGRRSA